MAAFRYVVVDVFTDEPLAGNQLAVFTDAREIPEAQLQRLAREMNLSETTFVYPPSGDGHVRMRIFTPATELPFAGHPTLGTAFVLAAPLQLGAIRIETAGGTVPVAIERDGARIVFGRIEFGDEIEISQGAEIGRPSTLYARAEGSADAVERVEVGGSAVVVARGELQL